MATHSRKVVKYYPFPPINNKPLPPYPHPPLPSNQPDIAELDGGSVATITFPSANCLTTFKCHVTPDSGYWTGATYEFTMEIPALYPHEPPKVRRRKGGRNEPETKEGWGDDGISR